MAEYNALFVDMMAERKEVGLVNSESNVYGIACYDKVSIA